VNALCVGQKFPEMSCLIVYPVCRMESCTTSTLKGVFCHVQVPGLAPPGVVIPQLASALRAGAPGPPGVVIPQLASK